MLQIRICRDEVVLHCLYHVRMKVVPEMAKHVLLLCIDRVN